MYRRLLACLREYKKHALLAPLFVSLEVIMEVLIPLLTARLIDLGIDKGDMRQVWIIGGQLVLSAVLSLIFGALSGRYAAFASAGFGNNLRQDMYYNVQSFSFANIDKFSSSGIVTRLTTDVDFVQNAFMMIIRVAARSPMMMIFALVMAFRLNASIALIFSGVFPVLGVGIYFIMSRAHPIFKRVFKTYDRLNQVVQENLRGIRVVKSFAREDHEKEKFSKVSGQVFSDFTKAEKLLAIGMPMTQAAMYLCILLTAWFGARLIVTSGGTQLTTGELTGLITYSIQILIALNMLSMVLVMMIISRAAAERIREILDEESSLKEPLSPIFSVSDGSVSFEDVSFSYAGSMDKRCLIDVNLEIRSGETIGVLGGTGSAKSSLVQLIPRLYDVTAGRVKVGGVDVKDYDIATLRDAVAMVLQKNELFSGTIADNLRWGNEGATDEEIREACRMACADEFVSAFPQGYDTPIDQGGTNVSGGQKQRLCIARALLKKPKILILDDSTSAVDTKTESAIKQAFKNYLPHVTKIIISQRVISVKDADRIIVMDNGHVNAFGTHEELMAGCRIYQEVYESQMKGAE